MGISVNLLAAILSGQVIPSGFLVDTTILADEDSTNRTTDVQFRLTLNPNLGGYNFRINWGDGSIDDVTCGAGTTPVVTTVAAPPGTLTEAGLVVVTIQPLVVPSLLHTYAAPGQYAFTIAAKTGEGFPAIAFNDLAGTSGSQPPLTHKSTDGLKLIEIQKWGTNNWLSMGGAFEGCVNLQITATDTARTSKVENWDQAFTQCRAMASFPHMDFSAATDITSCWNGCISLLALPPTLDFSKVTKSVFTFVGCALVQTMPPFDFSQSKDFQGCFQNMEALTSFPPCNFAEGTNFFNAFNGWDSFTGPFPSCQFPKATRIQNAWIGNKMSAFPSTVFPCVTKADSAWQGCINLVTCDVSLPKVTNLKEAFQGCVSLSHNPLTDVQTATSLESTFSGATLFKHDVGSWWPKLVTTMSSMFLGVDINDPASPVCLTLSSTSFDSANWTKTNSSVTANGATAPDGTLSGDLVEASATSSADHSVSQNITVVAASEYTVYCCFKPNTYTFGRLVVSGAFAADVFVDLTDGSVISSSGTVSVTPLANGWYKLSVTGIAATATLNVKCQVFSTGSLAAYAGNSVSGIYLWGGKAFLSVGGVVSNYDALLTGWTGWTSGIPSPIKPLQSNVSFNAGNSKYSLIGDAADARRYLVTVKGWTITDGGPY